MFKQPTPIVRPKTPVAVSQLDEQQFAYVDELRRSVRARVITEQQSGKSLAAIVDTAREMIRVAQKETRSREELPEHVFRALSRQSIAWCVEFYKPVLVAFGGEVAPDAPVATPKTTTLTLSSGAPDEGRRPLNYQPGKPR
jgi:hypothetical protein